MSKFLSLVRPVVAASVSFSGLLLIFFILSKFHVDHLRIVVRIVWHFDFPLPIWAVYCGDTLESFIGRRSTLQPTNSSGNAGPGWRIDRCLATVLMRNFATLSPVAGVVGLSGSVGSLPLFSSPGGVLSTPRRVILLSAYVPAALASLVMLSFSPITQASIFSMVGLPGAR